MKRYNTLLNEIQYQCVHVDDAITNEYKKKRIQEKEQIHMYECAELDFSTGTLRRIYIAYFNTLPQSKLQQCLLIHSIRAMSSFGFHSTASLIYRPTWIQLDNMCSSQYLHLDTI